MCEIHGPRASGRHVFHTSRQAMIKTYTHILDSNWHKCMPQCQWKDMSKINQYKTTTKINKLQAMFIILGIYCK